MEKNFRRSNSRYSKISDMFEEEDVADEDLARDMGMDLNTVSSLRRKYEDEENMDSNRSFSRYQ